MILFNIVQAAEQLARQNIEANILYIYALKQLMGWNMITKPFEKQEDMQNAKYPFN